MTAILGGERGQRAATYLLVANATNGKRTNADVESWLRLFGEHLANFVDELLNGCFHLFHDFFSCSSPNETVYIF